MPQPNALRLSECLDSDPENISTAFSHIGHMYTGSLSSYYYRRFDQALASASLSKSDRVLILGGGTGVFALSLAERVDEVWFSDIPRERPLFHTPQKLFEHATVDDDALEYLAADATQLPVSADSFDVVFALDVLEHVPDEATAITEIHRVTKPSGRVIVSAPIETGIPVLVREAYRFVDGRRRLTESWRELGMAALGNPIVDASGSHRGYDYTETAARLESLFDEITVEYCPVKSLKWLNPTAIITAT